MRHLAVFLAAAASVLAADFTTGQAARALIGQRHFTEQNPAPSQTVLGAAGGLAYRNGLLIVADSNRLGATPLANRVLIYRDLPQRLPSPVAEMPLDYTVRCPVCVESADVVLGQADFTKTDPALTRTGLRLPTGVATDGTHLVVADTDNNRLVIWNSIPTSNNAPADVVLGQPDFTSSWPNNDGSGKNDARIPNAKSLRGPQGVWIQDGKLFVADDQNHRVLIWNSIPTQNFAPADLVLGAPNFNTQIEPDLTKANANVHANTMLNPVGVSSDGQRLFVADLGHSRVLIWNSIPTTNQQAADFVLGQPDFESAIPNNSSALCPSNGADTSGNATYPARCAATMDFPRFVISDGTRVFVADGGNDRVLVWNRIPDRNGKPADVVLGQINDEVDQTSDDTANDNPFVARRSAANAVRTPQSLAWDGTNLFVSDPFNRRVTVFSPADYTLPLTAVRNAASMEIFAVGSVVIGGTLKENDEVTVSIGLPNEEPRKYTYKVKKDDAASNVVQGLMDLVNAGSGDPLVLASPNFPVNTLLLTARSEGEEGNSIQISTSLSANATTTATTSGTTLSGGRDAAKLGPGSLITVFGHNIADMPADTPVIAAPPGSDPLPGQLNGVEVYVDGLQAPLLAVTANQVNAQLPFEILDSENVSIYVRTKRADGSVAVSMPVAAQVIPGAPGIFAYAGPDPRPGVVLHYSSHAEGMVIIEGAVKAGDTATITIEDRPYTYTVKDGDTLFSIRDALIALIDASDPRVEAYPTGQFSYVRLRAKETGPGGNGLAISTSSTGGNLTISRTNEAGLCCANVEGAPVDDNNPAVPGETVVVYATGLGMIEPDEAKFAVMTGFTYKGPAFNKAIERVDSLAGGRTANVLFIGMKPGFVGLYEVHLMLNAGLPTDPKTQLWIAQDVNISNVVTFPVVKPE